MAKTRGCSVLADADWVRQASCQPKSGHDAHACHARVQAVPGVRATKAMVDEPGVGLHRR